MALTTEERQAVTYFTGYEVEHTICHGMFTLFVVGAPPIEEILQQVKKQYVTVNHIYFGTSQSFPDLDINDFDEWAEWEKLIKSCLDAGYWCTLDLDVRQAEGLLESGLCEYQRFVPMISVKLPHITLFNYNTTLKIDDRTWNDTNSGVWTHQLHDLMSKDKYTYWDQYTKDTEVESINDSWFDGKSFETYKKANPVKYQTAETAGTLDTLEGPVKYEAGYKIITGPKGEQYPIPSEKFSSLYDDNGDGTATPKKILKMAKLADHDGIVNTSWGEPLNYTAGNDYIVKHGTNDYGVIKKDIFLQTYYMQGNKY